MDESRSSDLKVFNDEKKEDINVEESKDIVIFGKVNCKECYGKGYFVFKTIPSNKVGADSRETFIRTCKCVDNQVRDARIKGLSFRYGFEKEVQNI